MSFHFSRRRSCRWLAYGLVALCLSASSCNRQKYPDDLPELHPLELTFSQEGQPLAEATITLFPEPPFGKWVAGGTTDESGKIRLKTQGVYPGVVTGKHKIVVSKVEVDLSSVVMTEYGPTSQPDSYHLVDPLYAEPGTTPLNVEVGEKNRSAAFDLGAATRKKIVATGP